MLGDEVEGPALRGHTKAAARTDAREGVGGGTQAHGPQDPAAGLRAALGTAGGGNLCEKSFRHLVPLHPAGGALRTGDPTVWEAGMPPAGRGPPPPVPKLLWAQPQPMCVPSDLQTGGDPLLLPSKPAAQDRPQWVILGRWE